MTRASLRHAVTTCFVIVGVCAGASADTIFFDDFSDGDAQDGMSATWDPMVPQFPGVYDASTGDYRLLPPPGAGRSGSFMAALVRDVFLSDASIRTRVRRIQDDASILGRVGLLAQLNPVNPALSADAYSGYEALIRTDRQLQIVRIDEGPTRTVLGSSTVAFDVLTDDIMLQFDLFDGNLRLWAWQPGTAMPQIANIAVTDSTYVSGAVGVTSGGPDVGAFRFVHVADTHIPEPSSFVRQPGDANEDREVNSADIILVSGAGKYETGEPATWSEGDWNGAPNADFIDGPPPGDGVFDSKDLIAALGTGLYESGPYAATPVDSTEVVNVPEPSTFFLTVVGLFGLFASGRRRRKLYP